MQNLEWYLADLKSTGKNTIETVEKSLTDMFIRLVRIYPCLWLQNTRKAILHFGPGCAVGQTIVGEVINRHLQTLQRWNICVHTIETKGFFLI